MSMSTQMLLTSNENKYTIILTLLKQHNNKWDQCCCQGLEIQGRGQGQGVKLQGQGQGQALDDETAQHLLLCCPAHTQARTSTSTSHMDSTDSRRIMNFLETIGAVTRPPDWE